MIRPTYSVRLRLFLLVLACVVPAAAMVITLIIGRYQQDLQQSRTNTIGAARALAVALDQHVIGVQASLAALASSELIASVDFAAFHARAKDVQIHNRASTNVLVRRDGQQRVNTAVPLGKPLPGSSVADKGIGIDAQHPTRMFGVFKRLHTLQEYPGNGIALAVSVRIVERHGGRLWVQSEPGVDNTFFFTTPDPKETTT